MSMIDEKPALAPNGTCTVCFAIGQPRRSVDPKSSGSQLDPFQAKKLFSHSVVTSGCDLVCGGMARGVKKLPKANRSSTTTSNTAATIPSTSTPSLPAPFIPAPVALLALTNTLPRNHVFLVHPESSLPGLRKRLFLVPVLLNIVIVAGLCWRLYYAVPVYLEQISTILGYQTPYSVKPKALSWSVLFEIVAYRTFYLTIDYALFGLLGRWPWEFLFGDRYGRHTSAFHWKWSVGFNREKEPIVRRARRWDASIYQSEIERKHQGKPEKEWTKEEELAVYTKCSDALRQFVTMKNALSLLDKDWDLDYRAMVDTAELIDAAKLTWPDLDHVVLVPWQGKWYSWYPHGVSTAISSGQPAKKQDEKLEEFKKALIELKCEDIFYRWIEIVQFETSQPAGLTPNKKMEMEQELKNMLEARNKDFASFLQVIGGLSSVPGLGIGR
ncbi:hypothetical protein LTR05_003093 [Lithohypha guttulata]|uniref:Uncharacterized protein n=1 Tax=Lithohypha guttulata TaxID=1690604 RepID=A0AAN7T398_9EURO|nr:hypothetical protein LTR05_003093 [Lithohypha guttulata]